MNKKTLPTLLDKQWQLRLHHFKHVATTKQLQWLMSVLTGKSKLSWQLKKVWSCSEFAAMSCSKKPDTLKQLIDSGDLYVVYGILSFDWRCDRVYSGCEFI